MSGNEHWPTEPEEKIEALNEALLDIKRKWSRGDTHEIPEPLERARSLASELDHLDLTVDDGGENVRPRDVTSSTFDAEDVYPDRDELERRAREDAYERFAPLPGNYAFEDVEIQRIFVEDGVGHYRAAHPTMGVFNPK